MLRSSLWLYVAASLTLTELASAQGHAVGSWEGRATLGASSIEVRLLVESADDTLRAGLDLTEMGELAMPFRVLHWDEGSVELALRTHLGLDRIEGRGAGLRSEPDPSSWFWEFYRGILDFDVEPVWDRVQAPALFLLGAQHPVIPVDETLARIDRENEGRTHEIEVLVFTGADHGLRVFPEPPAFDLPKLAEGSVEAQIEWIRARADEVSE